MPSLSADVLCIYRWSGVSREYIVRPIYCKGVDGAGPIAVG